MISPATSSVLFVRALVRGVIGLGGTPRELFERMGITEADLADPDARLPAVHNLRAWESAEALTGDRLFGLHVAQQTPLGAYGVLDWATRSASSIEHGLRQTVRYFRVLTDLALLTLDALPDAVRLTYRIALGDESPRHASEMLFATVIGRGRLHTGTRIVPRVVRFTHARSGDDAAEVERYFGCTLQWRAPACELELDHATLATPLLTAEPGLHEVLERHARDVVERLPATDSFVDRVRQVIADTLRTGDPDLPEVAKQLAMSTRTLQRRLAAEHTSFEAILDPLRRDAALRYLAEPTLSIGEIAFLLGYHDTSTFYRAFRRWAGTTPRAWRDARRR